MLQSNSIRCYSQYLELLGTQVLSSWSALGLYACSCWSFAFPPERLSEDEVNQNKVE